MIQDAIAHIDDSYTIRKLEEMVGINSVVGQEGELAEYLLRELDVLGLETETQEVQPRRPNVYGRLNRGKPGRRLNFNGHLDTIPVVEGWETDPFEPVRREETLIGLGSCDMKAGFACILTMLKAVQDSGLAFKGELSFSGVIDMDANIFAGVGKIPCLHLGPGRGVSDPERGGGTHEKNECVDLTWLPKVSRMYAKVADAFLNG